jgi:hypothetical protein
MLKLFILKMLICYPVGTCEFWSLASENNLVKTVAG